MHESTGMAQSKTSPWAGDVTQWHSATKTKQIKPKLNKKPHLGSGITVQQRGQTEVDQLHTLPSSRTLICEYVLGVPVF